MTDDFRSWLLPAADNPFDELLATAQLDDVTNGRRGTVLVEVDARGVPIVRTTTPYLEPVRPFRDIHDRLAREIRARGSLSHAFNNALVEHYTSAYSTMKRHSDQALDLADGSSIAVYSCYRDPQQPSRRFRAARLATLRGGTPTVPGYRDSIDRFASFFGRYRPRSRVSRSGSFPFAPGTDASRTTTVGRLFLSLPFDTTDANGRSDV